MIVRRLLATGPLLLLLRSWRRSGVRAQPAAYPALLVEARRHGVPVPAPPSRPDTRNRLRNPHWPAGHPAPAPPDPEGRTTVTDTLQSEATVTELELPAGPAVAVIDAVSTPVGGTALATSVVQVHLPLPDESRLLSLELSTPCAEDWELYSEVFAGIVRSVHLEFADLPLSDPGAAVPVPAADVEARVRAAFG
ncbi:hypothetical protein ACFVFS_13700 [Kitasatospora sp. NPDC057692]|uniref:hypothetical protein n=1 Tax=Kitasatospora sp. NPDC057692 TaxID=3346215 RepID=UPI003695704E